jgi:alpha-ketoglutarate-dependent taurine dioxygenase
MATYDIIPSDHYSLIRGVSRNEISPTMHAIGQDLGSTTFELALVGYEDTQPLRIHSESIYHEKMCPYFLLGCVEQAAEGGENTIYDAVEAARVLKREHPELLNVIMTYHAEHYDNTESTVPLVRSIGNAEEFLAFRERMPINEVHNLPVGWTEDSFYSYMRYLLNQCVEFKHTLSSGEILIVNNYKTLHCRGPFRGMRKIIRVRVDDPEHQPVS